MTTIATTNDPALSEQVAKLLVSLRPIFLDEGGDAKLLSLENGIARVSFRGGCEDCGTALSSMEGGLRLMLLERVDGLKEVIFE